MNLEEIAQEASSILEVVENYQWELGRLSQQVVDQYGYKALKDFSDQIEKVGGVRRTAGTLRMYAYVYKVSTALGIPRDILFSGCQSIVFSSDPQKYAKMAMDGSPGTEIRKQILQDKYAEA